MKIWATQRFFRYTSDGFDSHDISLLLAYLVQTRRLSTAASSIAAFQSVMTFLSENDLVEIVCNFLSTDISKRDQETQLKTAHLIHPISASPEGNLVNYNVLWRVSVSTLRSLREEASKSLAELQYHQETCFDHLFMHKKLFFQKHDLFFHFEINSHLLHNFHIISEPLADDEFDLADNSFQSKLREELDKSRIDLIANQYFPINAVDIITKALGDRAISVQSYLRCSQSKKTSESNKIYSDTYGNVSNFPRWSIQNNGSEDQKNTWVVSIGVTIDKDKGHRRVERGPSPDDDSQELEEFHNFWGSEKCQLRRFKDGSIVESVVWDMGSSESSDKKSDKELIKSDVIIDNIIRHVLRRHLPIVCGKNGNLIRSCLTSQLESFYQSLVTGGNKLKQKNTAEFNLDDSDSSCRHAIESLDQLRSILTSKIKNVPLSIESLMAVSPELRYSSVLPPRPQPILISKEAVKEYSGKSISLLTNPLKIIARLESSGKWPVVGEAILKSKLAVLLRIRSELHNQFQVILYKIIVKINFQFRSILLFIVTVSMFFMMDFYFVCIFKLVMKQST